MLKNIKSKVYQNIYLMNIMRKKMPQLEDLRTFAQNYLCASLLRTQFMSQCHATSCTSARANEEIYSHNYEISFLLYII